MKRRAFVRSAAVLGAAATVGARVPPAAAHRVIHRGSGVPADLVIRNGLVYDGSAGEPRRMDVVLSGGRIAELAPRAAAPGARAFDADGLAVAPGFIDIHSHTDLTLLSDPRAESKVRQGVTTEVTGQDGSSVAWSDMAFEAARERYRAQGVDLDFRDVAGFLRWIDRHGAAVNVASMIGTGTIRGLVIGGGDRRATPAELQRMTALIRNALDAGACGISSGLEYTPGAFADAAELRALATTLQGSRLPFASHMRNEDDRLIGAIEEIIGIGQHVACPVHISHLKAQGQRNWWKTDSALEMIEDARAAGVDITFDCYPYEAYATGLSNLFPVAAREGGTDAFIGRLRSPDTAAQIEAAVRDKIAMLGNWDAVQIASAGSEEYAWAAGGRLGALAQQRGLEPYSLLVELMVRDRARARMIGFGMSEANVARKLAHPLSMICSDGGAVTRADGVPHPRNYGTFPRVLGRFVRELQALPLALAVHKMTRMPADRLNFADRGRIETGAVADLVLFDPDAIADRATFENPHQFPAGIPHVLVNGTFVIENGEHTGARPGRAVRPA